MNRMWIQIRVQKILAALYEPDYVFLVNVRNFQPEQMEITARFRVPKSETLRYTIDPPEYATVIWRHLCLNQLAYVLVGLLVEAQAGQFSKLTMAEFKDAETGFRMRSLDEDFHHREILPIGQLFGITMKVSDARISARGLSLVNVQFSGAVSGKIRFAARLGVQP